MICRGDVEDVLPALVESRFDACLCDPPYGLKFMGKKWDHGVPSVEVWREVLRVLKPGAHMLAFGGTRTHHRLMCAIEDAGFEIRDCLMWLYGSGFPKSHNRFGFDGYGTALKPAWEPVILAMKPCDGTFAQNALEHGVAGLWVDGGRIDGPKAGGSGRPPLRFGGQNSRPFHENAQSREFDQSSGRWPANLLLDEQSAELLDSQTGHLKSGGRLTGNEPRAQGFSGVCYGEQKEARAWEPYGDSGGASRFFYCAKASKKERGKANNHPTVKPLALTEYLAALLLPPRRDGQRRRILVPFAGSGSEVIGAIRAGWDDALGIERDEESSRIAEHRIESELENRRIP